MAIWRGVGGSGESTNDSTVPTVTALLVDAEAARDAAQLAETNAETAASNAASSASTASTQASNAATSATNAASSASSASTSATNAASSASTASTQASNAAASASSASTSATNAASSATSAASSASTATTKASEASTSATNAAASASSASSSATTATTKASEAAASASAAATSATNAASSATSAASSASAASTSATNAASSATSAATSASTATTQATNASNSASAASTSATSASTSATNAASSATTATTQAGIATTQASNAASSATSAATQASNAATSATNAASSATSAASSATAAAASYDSFDDRYLGAKSSAPSVDNDGNALLTGALYFDSSTSTMKVWSGSAWLDAYASLSGALLATNNLSDLNNTATARTNLGVAIGSNVQAWDADLDAIAALAGTSGFLKKTAANTWSLDTSTYLTGNQTVTLSGDITGSGATSITTTLANSGVTAGTYTKVTVDAKGRVTVGASLASGDLPTYTGTISSSQITTGLGYTPVSAAGGTFTANPTLSAGTANGVLYLNGSKVATSGSALVFDGTNLSVGTTPSFITNYAGIQIYSSLGSTLKLTNSTTGATSTDGFELILGNNSSDAYIWQRENAPLIFGVNSSEQMRLTTTGLGIGTSSPAYKLDIYSASGTAALQLKTSTNPAWTINSQIPGVSNSGFAIRDESVSTNRFVIDSSGNIGIGTGSPNQRISVASGAGVGAAIEMAANGGTLGTTSFYVGQGSGGIAYVYQRSSTNPLIFATNNGGNTMTYNNSGNLGLGVTPSAWASGWTGLQVGPSGSVSNSGTGTPVTAFSNNAYYNGTSWVYINTAAAAQDQLSTSRHIWRYAASGSGNITWSEAMRLDTSGNLGIGTSSPSYKLHILSASGYTSAFKASTAATTGILVGNTAGDTSIQTLASGDSFISSDTSKYLAFGTSSTERMRITSGGNLGLGTTSPSDYGAGFRMLAVSGSSTGIVQVLNSTDSVTTEIESESTRGAVGTRTNHPLVFKTNQTERARITSTGAWSFGSSGTATGTSGQVLTSNGSGSAPSWQDAGGGPVKAWVNFNGTGTVAIRASSNVSSITDNGTGTYTVNFTTAFADANYAPACMVSEDTGSGTRTMVGPYAVAPTTTAFRVGTFAGSTLTDMQYVQIVFVR